jgi:hypothetical protein
MKRLLFGMAAVSTVVTHGRSKGATAHAVRVAESRRRWRRLVFVATLAVAGCGGGGSPDDVRLSVETSVRFEPGTEPAALAPLPDGGLVVGERRTGRVRVLSADGNLEPEALARVAVAASEDDQRGLLGLAVAGDRVFAAWTRAADGRLVVAEVSRDAERLVWAGPQSSDLANGGHLAFLPDGRLVVGVGDLQHPGLVDDPAAPNGKLLALDPTGPPSQRPEPLSGGWNNPFAFVVTAGGDLWVADNAPGDDLERIGRGDRQARGSEPMALPGRRAPAALVEFPPGHLGLCGYLDGELTAVEVDGREPRPGDRLATGCRTGAAVLTDGRLAVSDGEQVRILAER